MALRLACWISAIKFFVEEFKKKLGGEKISKFKDWAEAILDFIGGFADNYYFLFRVSAQKTNFSDFVDRSTLMEECFPREVGEQS